MKLDGELIKKIQEVAKRAGGYLTTDLYDKNRDDLPTWETLKKKIDIEFPEVLKRCGVLNKEEHLKIINKTKAISNLKLLGLEQGEVSKTLYDSSEPKLYPTSDYISKYYGWNEIVKYAGVKLANSQYLSTDEAVKELKKTIKDLGYIPTSTEYKKLNLKPTQDVLRSLGFNWTAAMKKAGYKPYEKKIIVNHKICKEDDCFRQFESTAGEVYCESCFKDIRSRLIKGMDSMSQTRLKEISSRLMFSGNSQKTIIDIFKSL